jgi:hypothetical protein
VNSASRVVLFTTAMHCPFFNLSVGNAGPFLQRWWAG